MNRKQLTQAFESDDPVRWKTILVEAHPAGDAERLLNDAFGSDHVLATDDAFLHRVVVADEAPITVDHLDERFWSFHSDGSAKHMKRVLRSAINSRRDLDHVWLPSEHLSKVHRGAQPTFARTDFKGREVLGSEVVQELSLVVRGRGAEGLLADLNVEARHALSVSRLGGSITDDGEQVEEFVDHRAVFVAHGTSFALHQQVVSEVVSRYRTLVEAAESLAFGFSPLTHDEAHEGGARLQGGPIELCFSRPIPSVVRLVASLVSSREPFRLWGIPEFHGENYAVVDAVDLHVGTQLRLELGPQMVRVQLRAGGCGNSVARLIANLQHHVDGSITATDDRIQAALEARQLASVA